MANSLKHFDGERHDLLAWVVMDDHVHLVVTVREGFTLSGLLHTWKSYSANRLQKDFDREGVVWEEETFDRIIRNEKELMVKCKYVMENPLRRWSDAESYKWMGCHPSIGDFSDGQGRPSS